MDFNSPVYSISSLHTRRNSALTNVLNPVGTGTIIPHTRTVWFSFNGIGIYEYMNIWIYKGLVYLQPDRHIWRDIFQVRTSARHLPRKSREGRRQNLRWRGLFHHPASTHLPKHFFFWSWSNFTLWPCLNTPGKTFLLMNLKLIELYPLKPHHLQRAKTPLWPPGQKLSLIFLSIWICLPLICWHTVWGKNSLSVNQSESFVLFLVNRFPDAFRKYPFELFRVPDKDSNLSKISSIQLAIFICLLPVTKFNVNLIWKLFSTKSPPPLRKGRSCY